MPISEYVNSTMLLAVEPSEANAGERRQSFQESRVRSEKEAPT